MNDIQVYWLGLKDGFAQPVQLSSGITWEDDRDKVYDHGVNAGQIAGWLLRPSLWRERPQPWQAQ